MNRHRGAYDIDECTECVTCNVIKANGRHRSFEFLTDANGRCWWDYAQDARRRANWGGHVS